MRLPRLLCLMLLLFLLPGSGLHAQENRFPTDREGWKKRLVTIQDAQGDDHWVLYQFANADPEIIRDVLHDIWKNGLQEKPKNHLISTLAYENGRNFRFGADGRMDESLLKVNPYLLDILDMGAKDSSPAVRSNALSCLFLFAFRDIPDQKAYLEWRKEIGSRPLEEVVRDNVRVLMTQIQQAETEQKSGLLNKLSRLSFQTGSYSSSRNGKVTRGVIAPGLVGVRRRAVLEAGLMELMAQMLQQTQPAGLRQRALQFLMQFQPESESMERLEAEIKREILSRNGTREETAYDTLWFLGYYNSRWATEMLLTLTEKHYPGDNPWMFISALCSRRDPIVVPTLIALMDATTENQYEVQQIQVALSSITGVPAPILVEGGETEHDGDWWREWWRKNRMTLPAEARDRPFPRLKVTATLRNGLSIRRRKAQVQINDDPKRTYWLISAGRLIEGGKPKAVADQKPDPVISQSGRPGLLVVLADSEKDIEGLRSYWQELLGKAFQGRYLAALVVPPRWTPDQNPLWVTRKSRSQVKEATFSIEGLVAEVVKDVEKRYPINPERIFLQGVGEGGQAVCACALEPQTPFRGFALVGGAFRSAGLPSPTAARGRRFIVQHSQNDRVRPFFLATAAQGFLQKAGAIVRLAPFRSEANTPLDRATPEQVIEAIRWLEGAK